MPMIAASPFIVSINKDLTEEMEDQINNLRKEMREVRLRGMGGCTIWRKTHEGTQSVSSLNNKLNRCSKHMNYYFTNPVFVNYDGATTRENILANIGSVRYVDLSCIYIVDMAKDGSYTVALLSAIHENFTIYENVGTKRGEAA
jgi:hypothetical protein